MANTSTFPPLVSRKTPIIIVLAGSIVTLGPSWRSCIPFYIGPLVKRLNEETHPHPLARMKLVAYSQIHPALIDPVYDSVVGHDEDGDATDPVIIEDSPDNAAYRGYVSVIEIIDRHQARHPNEEFSFFLWHVVAGQHGSWDRKWEKVSSELLNRNVNVSMVFLDDCQIFVQLFSAISPTRSRITPWFHSPPDLTYLLSGFMPPDELGGAVPSLESAADPALSIFFPSTIGVTARDPPCELPAHETRYPEDNQWTMSTFSQHEGLEDCAQVLAMPPLLNPYEDPLVSSLIAAQNQPHPDLNNMSVPEARGLDPMDQLAPPHSSETEQQQIMPYNYTERTNSRDDFANANANASPMSSGSSDEMSDDEWTGTLNLKGTRVPVRALMAKAVGNPKLSGFPKDLEVEPSVGPKLSTLAIQAWIRQNKTPMVQLSPGTSSCKFDQLVEEIRDHGFAIVRWKNRDRLLLAPLGKVLLCAAFQEKGTTKRPTPQPPRKVRTVIRQKKNGSETPHKKENPPKTQKQKSRHTGRSRPYPATSPKSSNGPCDGQYHEVAAQNTITLLQPRLEQPQMPCYPPVAMEFAQDEIDSSSQWYQMGGFVGPQMTSPPLFQVEQHHDAYLQSPRGELGDHEEQLVPQWVGTDAADCMAVPSNVKPEAMDLSEMFQYVDLDGYGVQYDMYSAS